MLLVLSTLPHYLSIIPLIPHRTRFINYINIIIIATSFSILYHATGESNLFITILDYLAAAVWFMYELKFTIVVNAPLFDMLSMNAFIFFTNIMIPYNQYYILHSLWHLLNAYKCWRVAFTIAQGQRASALQT